MTAAECRNCKASGFPNQMIDFVKDGLKPDGSSKYRVINPDKSLHQHKKALQTMTAAQPDNNNNEGAKQGHLENIAMHKEMLAALRHLSDMVAENTKAQNINGVILESSRQHLENIDREIAKVFAFKSAAELAPTVKTEEDEVVQ